MKPDKEWVKNGLFKGYISYRHIDNPLDIKIFCRYGYIHCWPNKTFSAFIEDKKGMLADDHFTDLTSNCQIFHFPENQLDQFAEQLKVWSKRISVNRTKPYRADVQIKKVG
jgi:hypothetical protein